MAHPLRDRGTPRALAESRQSIDFKGKLSEFARLSGIVRADLETVAGKDRPADWQSAPVRVDLEFGFADARQTLPAVTGKATATLAAVCQRCLEAFVLPVDVTIRYVLQKRSEAGNTMAGEAYDDYDLWELDEKYLVPQALVEEALIMALPLSAVHPSSGDCGPLVERAVRADNDNSDTVRPFAGLRAMIESD